MRKEAAKYAAEIARKKTKKKSVGAVRKAAKAYFSFEIG